MTRALCLALPATVLVLAGGTAAPVPEPNAPPVRAATLQAVLGKSYLGKEVRAVTRGLGEFPQLRLGRVLSQDAAKDDGKEDDGFYLTWKTRGVEMACESGKVKAVFLYNKGADGFDRYPGELPDGLTLDDDPGKVERKLGKAGRREEFPEVRKVGGKPQDELWLFYDSKELWVIFCRLPGQPYAIHSVHLDESEGD